MITQRGVYARDGNYDTGQARALGAGAVPPGTYWQTSLCHLVSSRGLLD